MNMKHIASNSEKEVLRFDSGDDILAGVIEFAEKKDIKAAWVWMIGSSKETELGFYDLGSKEYKKREFKEDMEIVNVSGNIGRMDGKPILHLHGSFSSHNFNTWSGHIHKLIANATAEVFLLKIENPLDREYDRETGLNLFKSV